LVVCQVGGVNSNTIRLEYSRIILQVEESNVKAKTRLTQ
jgi:hypothetical protein